MGGDQFCAHLGGDPDAGILVAINEFLLNFVLAAFVSCDEPVFDYVHILPLLFVCTA